MKKILILFIICNLGFALMKANAQYVDTKKVDAATKLYLAKPDYKTPYGETNPEAVKAFKEALKEAREAEDDLRKALEEGGWLNE